MPVCYFSRAFSGVLAFAVYFRPDLHSTGGWYGVRMILIGQRLRKGAELSLKLYARSLLSTQNYRGKRPMCAVSLVS